MYVSVIAIKHFCYLFIFYCFNLAIHLKFIITGDFIAQFYMDMSPENNMK